MSQRLAGASLLVFANKQDLPGAMTAEDIKQVKSEITLSLFLSHTHTHTLSLSLSFRCCSWTL